MWCAHPHSLLYPRYLNGPSLSGSNSLIPAVLTANFSSAPTKCCSVICSTNDENLQACHLETGTPYGNPDVSLAIGGRCLPIQYVMKADATQVITS